MPCGQFDRKGIRKRRIAERSDNPVEIVPSQTTIFRKNRCQIAVDAVPWKMP